MTNPVKNRKTTCEICDSAVVSFGNSMVLGSHNVQYFRCKSCGFLQTEHPFWLDEAYSSPIASLDIGLLQRNQRFASIGFRIFRLLLRPEDKCIDYGGGYGVFVRLMRDRGVPFFHYDPMAENLFAKSFTATLQDSFELATAFEVLEHLSNPHEHFSLLDRIAPHWLVSPEMLADDAPALDDWWYYSQDTGQHISFYSRSSLNEIARRYGRRLISSGTGLHFFTKSTLPASYIRWILRNRSSKVFDRFIRKPSFIQSDYIFAKEQLVGQRKAI